MIRDNAERFAYIRPQKAKTLCSYYNHYFVEQGTPECVTVNDANILPARRMYDDAVEYGHGGVSTVDGYVGLSASPERIEGAYSVSDLESVDEIVVYCGYFNPAWGHFLMESLSRLWILGSDLSNRVDKYVFISDYGGESLDVKENFRQVFSGLGIEHKVDILTIPRKYRCVIVPQEAFTLTSKIFTRYNTVFDKIIQHFANGDCRRYAKRIFLGRASLPKAKKYEIGIGLIEDFFVKNGYEIIYPERIPLSELIRSMQNADEIATMSGSTAHNLLFAPKNARCVVVEKYAYVNYYQTAIDILRNLEVSYIDANSFVYSVSPGLGPFILKCNKWLSLFAESRGFDCSMFTSNDKSTNKRQLKEFVRLYKREYGYQWYLPEWLLDSVPMMYEAYSESYGDYHQWLSGEQPLCISDLMNPYYFMRWIYRCFRSKFAGLR